MTTAPGAPSRLAQSTARRAGRRANRAQGLAAAVMLLAAGAMCVFQHTMLVAETWLVEKTVSLLLDTETRWKSGANVFFYDWGTDHPRGLTLELACSIILLLVPLLLISATLMATGRASLRRVVTLTLLAGLMLIVINQIRCLMIVSATRTWGDMGFGWFHTVIGSFVVLIGLAATLFQYFRLIGRGSEEAE